jgi:RimJ/RimL family protein N-acetyltransferase
MKDLQNYSAQEILKNGLEVTIRAIRPDDREAFLAAFKGLEDRSLYYRFFSPKTKLSDKELTAAVEVDFVKTVALVTCVKDKESEKIIGGGRFIVFGKADPPDKAEVAFMVEEDYQGLGIASRILKHLAGIAKARGVEEFHADVLSDNTGMLNVFKRCGFPMKQAYESGVAHVILSFTGSEK